jgi:hypothetical protein
MNAVTLKDAAAKVWDLSQTPRHRKYMMPQVEMLLGEFRNAARRSRNGYALEKIGEVRSWFNELGKLGRGHWPIELAQGNAQQSISKLEQLIDIDGTRLHSMPGPPPGI